jgi:hypothetical protein
MAQRAQVIDITKSYLPGDPNTYVQSLVNTDREDGEEKTLPVLPYEGYNFLPTAQGYKSYFGTNLVLDIEGLNKNVQFILSFQLSNYKTRLIALCADGIWVCNANVADSTWTHPITLTDTPSVFEEWTWCVLENTLYMYRQGQASAWKTGESAGELTIATHTPTFLNMAGQMGIFKAGLRLGFWDSANSVSWSSNLDLTDFTSSIETLAGNSIFGDIVGRIITIRAHGEGFIIYSTRSVVGVNFDTTGNLLWDSKKIFDNIGISYSRAVTYGQSDAQHFVYATNGIYAIGKYNSLAGKHEIELIIPEVYDFLKTSRDPIYLDTINSRYVFFHILNPDYVYGLTSFDYVTPPDLNVRFMIGGYPWDGNDLPAINIDGNAAAEALRQLVTFGFSTLTDTTALWIAILSESQDGTVGPLSSGGGTRAAQTPGFTEIDIENTYSSGSTLPGELELDVFEHANISEKYLGNVPSGSYQITGALSSSLIKKLYDQQTDWDLYKQHQTASFTIIAAASKATTTAGVSVVAYTSVNAPALPALPAPSIISDVVIGTYKTGKGNTEIQLNKPLRKLVLRKYWQESVVITKRTTRTWANRAGTPVSGYETYYATSMTATEAVGVGSENLTPNTISIPAMTIRTPGSGGTGPHEIEVRAALFAAIPSTVTIVYNSHTANKQSVGSSSTQLNFNYVGYDGYDYGVYRLNGSWASTYAQTKTLTPIYQDYTDTITYIIGAPVTGDYGYTDASAIQSDYTRTTINVTSSPPTIVVHSLTPIFPTGPSAITFFPPTWTGVQTLKLIAASALQPWHLIDGTFGIELVGDPISGADAIVDAGGLIAAGDGFIGTDYGTTYSSFPYVLQIGSPFIYYPTFEGSIVLDLALKKWGKQKNQFQVLIGLDALNQFNPTTLTEDDEGMNAALHLIDNTIKIFDESPSDSILRYGKIGSYRQGFTDMLEVKAYNKKAVTGSLMVDSSLDGRNITASLRYTLGYTSARIIEAYPDISARWHIVTFSGNYDLTGLEVRATLSGRR